MFLPPYFPAINTKFPLNSCANNPSEQNFTPAPLQFFKRMTLFGMCCAMEHRRHFNISSTSVLLTNIRKSISTPYLIMGAKRVVVSPATVEQQTSPPPLHSTGVCNGMSKECISFCLLVTQELQNYTHHHILPTCIPLPLQQSLEKS